MLGLVVILSLLCLLAYFVLYAAFSRNLTIDHALLRIAGKIWAGLIRFLYRGGKRTLLLMKSREHMKSLRNKRKRKTHSSCSPYALLDDEHGSDHNPTILNLSFVDDLGETVHPDVQQLPTTFANGMWKYAMTLERYPCAYNRLENPEFLVSTDGIHWKLPDKGAHPVILAPEDGVSYHSDASLLMLDDVLHLIYRILIIGKDYETICELRDVYTVDGVHWQENGTIYQLACGKKNLRRLMSPSFLMIGEEIQMWYVDSENGRDRILKSVSNRSMKSWTEPEEICMEGLLDEEFPWHMDVIFDNGKYHALVMGRNRMTSKQNMYYTISSDGKKWKKLEKICCPAYAFEENGFYRGCLVRGENGSLMVYYTGIDKNNLFQTAVMKLDKM